MRVLGKINDSVDYFYNNQIQIGNLYLILIIKRRGAQRKIDIIKRLCVTEPNPENSRAVTMFGHKSYEYDLQQSSDNDVVLD